MKEGNWASTAKIKEQGDACEGRVWVKSQKGVSEVGKALLDPLASGLKLRLRPQSSREPMLLDFMVLPGGLMWGIPGRGRCNRFK